MYLCHGEWAGPRSLSTLGQTPPQQRVTWAWFAPSGDSAHFAAQFLKSSDGNRCLSFHAHGTHAATPYTPLTHTLWAIFIAALPCVLLFLPSEAALRLRPAKWY